MGNKPQLNDAELGERRMRAYQLRLEGKTLRDIGSLLGYSKDTVKNDIQFELDKRLTPLADEERKRQLDQLDMLIARVWQTLESEIYVTQHGKLVTDSDGNPFVDHEMTLKVANQFAKLLDQRARLTGAYMPAQTEATVTVQDTADLAVMDLIAQHKAKRSLSEGSQIGNAQA